MIAQCPSEADIEAFAMGNLSASRIETIAEHLSSCGRCNELLAASEHVSDEWMASLSGMAVSLIGDPAKNSMHSHRESLPARDASEDQVPPHLLEIARTAAYRSASSELPLDPGKKIARKLREGGYRLGRFELEAELGVGAFGYVFRARDTRLDRTVALKVQRAGSFASAEDVERFLREARSVAQLQHPGIVAIHDSVRTEDDVCYLVTEYVEGRSLERVMAEEPLETREAVRLIAETAEALQYAHDHGVVHRDVKPSNILIDQAGHPHVMDFGLAKRDIVETLTSDGRVMGTPAYMSPEQASGRSHEVDARSDIYSLGVILYEMLTGERPFQGNRRMLLLQVLEDDPRPPRQLNHRVPRDLETIALKALSKSPSRRYLTAADLADDLRRYLRGDAIRARRASYAERLIRWCRRYPVAASLLIAVPLGSAVGFSYLTNLSTYFVHQSALEGIRMQADMLEKINDYYSEEVVGRLDWNEIPVTHLYGSTPQSLPLPFTFMIDAGERITADVEGMEVRIYSRHPWRDEGGPQSAFEERALEAFATQKIDTSNDRSYHEFTDLETRPVLQYARAQVMKESCVKCHNDHAQSPKRDWKEGDLAGVLMITRPLDRDIETTRVGLRGAFNWMGSIATFLTVLSLALLWTSHRKSERRAMGVAIDE